MTAIEVLLQVPPGAEFHARWAMEVRVPASLWHEAGAAMERLRAFLDDLNGVPSMVASEAHMGNVVVVQLVAVGAAAEGAPTVPPGDQP